MTCPGGTDGAGGRLGDIIDLDRYMRAAVRRSASDTTDDGRNERLVVDCGGVKPGAGVGASALSSSSAECTARAHHKRYSHDSGLSDGSYAPRTRRPHRRSSAAEGGGGRFGRETRETRDTRPPRAATGSTNSLREFRTVCERALLDQQQQLARVTQLCERLTAPPPPPRAAPDTSELSSSSCSTKDQRRKDKNRANECKTYKIIMNKLDELNRLFAARGRFPPADIPRASLPVASHRCPQSSYSVPVSDKLVSTELVGKLDNTKLTSHIVENGKQVEWAAGGEFSTRVMRPSERERRVVRAVTHAYALDIAPKDVMTTVTRRERPNVTTESIVERGSTGDEYASSACDPRCGFDLDDPVHLYAQSKRLQALHASTRRSKSAGYEASAASRASRLGERLGERLDKRASTRESSLCAVCRGYWRAVRRYIWAQLTGPNT